jgi:hypothetical protein
VLAAAVAVGGATMHVASASEPQAAGILPLVDFERTGGIAGVDERLVVQPAGNFSKDTAGKHCEGTLTPQQVESLRAGLNRADIASLPSAEAPGADFITYKVTHAGATVRTYEGGVPAKLQPVVKELAKLSSTPC